ncbi:MAG: tetratricopeptide repeat protein [Nitrospinota bacterium]|nr:tetratricopeptide repeat protein [Nitrospinota bacterium]
MAKESPEDKLFATLEKCAFLVVGFPQNEAKFIKQTLRERRIQKVDEITECVGVFEKLELAQYHFLIMNAEAASCPTLLSKLVACRRFMKTPLIVFSKSPKALRGSYKKKQMIGRFLEMPFTAAALENALLGIAGHEKYDKNQITNISEALEHYNKGTKHFEEEELDEAEKELMLCVKADPGFIDGYTKLAEILIEKKNFELAMKVLKKAVSVDPEYGEIFYFVGLIHSIKDNKDSAISAFDKASEVEPENVHLLIDLGNACLDKNWIDDALRYFNLAKSKNPEFLQVYNRIGIALSRAGRFVEAEVEYQRAMQLDPSDAGVRFNMGMMYHRQKDNKKAADFFKKAIQLDPTLEEAKNMLKKATA